MTGLTLGQLREIAKKHGKEYGRDFIIWAQKNGILKDPANVNRESNEEIAKRAKFENRNAYAKHLRDGNVEYRRRYLREWRYVNGIQVPMSENVDCAHYLGTYIAERKYGRIILPEIFGNIEREMPYGNPKYDFVVTGNIKIDIKSCCLRKLKGWIGWEPHIRFNNVTDYFVILAFDDRENLNLIHVWLIGKDEIIRCYKYHMRDSIKITNTMGSIRI